MKLSFFLTKLLANLLLKFTVVSSLSFSFCFFHRFLSSTRRNREAPLLPPVLLLAIRGGGGGGGGGAADVMDFLTTAVVGGVAEGIGGLAGAALASVLAPAGGLFPIPPPRLSSRKRETSPARSLEGRRGGKTLLLLLLGLLPLLPLPPLIPCRVASSSRNRRTCGLPRPWMVDMILVILLRPLSFSSRNRQKLSASFFSLLRIVLLLLMVLLLLEREVGATREDEGGGILAAAVAAAAAAADAAAAAGDGALLVTTVAAALSPLLLSTFCSLSTTPTPPPPFSFSFPIPFPLNRLFSGANPIKCSSTALAALSPLSKAPFNVAVFR